MNLINADLPLPDLDILNAPDSESRYHPPALHSLRPENSIHDQFFLRAMEIQKNCAIVFQNHTIQITAQPKLMTGKHSWIAEIAPKQAQLFQDVKNEEILVKTYSRISILTRNPEYRVFSGASHTALDQYAQMKYHGIPVAKLFNYLEAKAGCGFYLFEKLPSPIEVPWDIGADIHHFSLEQNNYLNQITYLFQRCVQNHIRADLQPKNLSFSKDGQLKFIDFREDETENVEEELQLELPKMLKAFNCREGDGVYQHITESYNNHAAQ